MPLNETRVWETVRRTLARLFSSVQTLTPSDTEMRLAPVFGSSNPLTLLPGAAGSKENAWKPDCAALTMPLPETKDGGHGADLSAIPVVVSCSAAIDALETCVLDGSLPSEAAEVYRSEDVVIDPAECIIRDGPMVEHGRQTVKLKTRFEDVAVCVLACTPPALGRKRGFLAYSRERDTVPDFLNLGRIAVKTDLPILARLPFSRTRCAPPDGFVMAQAFAAERRQLAAASSVALDDVVLLGVYTHVPITSVRQLALEDAGETLTFWLKPDALEAAATGKMPRRRTLVVGRRRSNNQMIQMIA